MRGVAYFTANGVKDTRNVHPSQKLEVIFYEGFDGHKTSEEALRKNQLQIATGQRKSPETLGISGLSGCGGWI